MISQTDRRKIKDSVVITVMAPAYGGQTQYALVKEELVKNAWVIFPQRIHKEIFLRDFKTGIEHILVSFQFLTSD